MASAASLNATATIINGQGLSTNANLLAAISTFQSSQTLQLLGNIFTNANGDGNVLPILGNLGNTATKAQWLLDFYPSNISPTSSGSITYYGIIITPIYGTGIHANDIIGNTASPVVSTASFSSAIKTQAQLPFASGMSGFANVFFNAQGYASSVFDTVASVNLLQHKTYAESGLGYAGVTDLVTGGVGTHAGLLGDTVNNWGTMYDITNINLINDPYVFGQNLLNQNLGSFGNLEAQLAATGLDTTDITRVPASETITTHEAGSLSTSSFVGQVDLPIVANVTTSTTVTGNSPSVILKIYANITGADLKSIMSATGFKTTNTTITSLADLLDFERVVDQGLLPQLKALGIDSFKTFSVYLNSRVGQGTFRSWTALGEFLTKIEIPTITHLASTTSTTGVLSASTISTLNAETGLGSGPFNNPVMSDYFGAAAGMPYTSGFATLNAAYSTLVTSSLTNSLSSLDRAVSDYVTAITANANAVVDTGTISSNVVAVNSALNSIPSSTTLTQCETAYFSMLNKMAIEVSNLTKAGATFGPGPARLLLGFGQQVPSLAGTDVTGLETDVVMANLITNDVYGDTIRAAVAERNNIPILGSGGATVNNDPNPQMTLAQANAQGIPLTTYLSQNK